MIILTIDTNFNKDIFVCPDNETVQNLLLAHALRNWYNDKELDKGDPTPRARPYPDPTGDREEDIRTFFCELSSSGWDGYDIREFDTAQVLPETAEQRLAEARKVNESEKARVKAEEPETA